MENQSNVLLKVSGILMIIGGILGIILGIIAVLGVGVFVAAAGKGANLGILMTASILVLISMIFTLIAGIVGVKNAANPEKANTCIMYGFIIVGFTLLGNILSVVGGNSFNFTGLLIGLVLPAIYLVGAFQNKKLAEGSLEV